MILFKQELAVDPFKYHWETQVILFSCCVRYVRASLAKSAKVLMRESESHTWPAKMGFICVKYMFWKFYHLVKVLFKVWCELLQIVKVHCSLILYTPMISKDKLGDFINSCLNRSLCFFHTQASCRKKSGKMPWPLISSRGVTVETPGSQNSWPRMN